MNKKVGTTLGATVLVIIAITASTFVWMYEKNQPAIEQAVQAPLQAKPVQQVAVNPINGQNYLEVKELGFKIPMDAAMLGDLTYEVNQQEQSVHFFSKTLSAINKECANKDGITTVAKVLGRPSDNAPEYIKQFDGFVLHSARSQYYCVVGSGKPTDIDKKNMDMQDSISQGILSGLKNAVLIDQVSTSDTLNAKISSLEQKWKNGGLTNWQKEDFIIPGMSVIAPRNNPKTLTLSSDQKEIKKMSIAQTGLPIVGIVSIAYENANLYGVCAVTQSDLPQGMSLEQWMQNTWHSAIAKNDCNGKNQPLTAKTDRGDLWSDVCKKGANIQNKINDNLIRWDANYIGSPPIVSVVIGNKVVNFECGQDVSSVGPLNGKQLDFMSLVEDIAGTLH